MKEDLDHKAIFRAAYREAVALSKEAHIGKRGLKHFVDSNTWAIYNDCKRNPELRKYILDKHGR